VATRLYLPLTGTSPVAPPHDAAWEVQSTNSFPTSGTKLNSALVDVTIDPISLTSTHQEEFGQWITGTLDVNQTISGTVSIVVRGLESAATANAHLAFSLRVIKPDLTDRGVLLLQHAAATEFVTAAETRIHNALAIATVNGLAGDRIVMEVGGHFVTPASGTTLTLRLGDPSATGDFALTSGLTTDLCPWFELSQTLTFGSAPSAPPPSSGSIVLAPQQRRRQ
jgi:hypothetical protein